ncbi:MAG: four helix bundle protein [Acidobacteria bacterium]|nr:four helix bundle protein [Acidobacteriota bacterium]
MRSAFEIAAQVVLSPTLMGVRRYQDLVVWQLAEELRREVCAVTAKPPVSRDLRFCDQLRRAAASPAANIAEGFVRFSHPEMAKFLGYARGSLAELHSHLNEGLQRGYLNGQQHADLSRLAARTAIAAARLQAHVRQTRTPHA